MENNLLTRLEEISKELNQYEKKGLDTSSLKIFIKSFKEFLKINRRSDVFTDNLTSEEKLLLIKTFLEDKKAFPKISDVISFVNERLQLEFKDQKESREITINRIIGRIKTQPEIKEKLKQAVLAIRNEKVSSKNNRKSKKEIISADTFNRWADIIKNI